MKNIIYLIAIVFIFSSCSKDESIVPSYPKEEVVTYNWNLFMSVPKLGIIIYNAKPISVQPVTQYSFITKKNEESGKFVTFLYDGIKVEVFYDYKNGMIQANGIISSQSFIYDIDNKTINICQGQQNLSAIINPLSEEILNVY